MAFAAVPRPAAATTEALLRFVLTIYVPSSSVSGDTLTLFLEAPAAKGSGEIFLFCAPLSHPGPNPAGPCQGGGKQYTINVSLPSGTDLFYQFQDVKPSGRLIILQQGSFTAFPAPGGGVSATVGAIIGMPPASTSQQQCTCGTGPGFGPLPNTAVAAPVADRGMAVLPALGILMVLLAAAISTRRRRLQSPAEISAE
jgi:hypothetical protein